jgi:thymidylate kinase
MTKLNNKLIVSIMGVDGSGKTTISKKIEKMFDKSKYLHLKPYIIFQDRRTVIKNPHKETKSTITVSFFRLLSWLISYKFFFFINKNHKIYIFDRYAHDIIIDPLRYKHNLSKNLTKLILSFFPKPDLWIFLKPTQKTINSRKHELSEAESRRQMKEYSNFFKNKTNVLKLNTNNHSKASIKLIKNKIKYLIK